MSKISVHMVAILDLDHKTQAYVVKLFLIEFVDLENIFLDTNIVSLLLLKAKKNLFVYFRKSRETGSCRT